MANPFDLSATILNYYSGMAAADASEAAGAGMQIAAEFEAQQHFANAKQRVKSGQVEANQILDRGQVAAMGYRSAGTRAVSDSKVAMVAQGGTVDNYMLAKMKAESDRDATMVMYDARMSASNARNDAAMDAMKMNAQGRITQLEGQRAKSQAKTRANWQRINTVANTLQSWKWGTNFGSKKTGGYKSSWRNNSLTRSSGASASMP